jgi:hypothetical protein
MFSNFYKEKNFKSANNSTTTEDETQNIFRFGILRRLIILKFMCDII